MDKILTVREPFASALVHGIKKAEYRSWRIPKGSKVWIHAGLQPAMGFANATTWLREQGETSAADYMEWTLGTDDTPRPELVSPLSHAIHASLGFPDKLHFPFGKVIGYCVFGESVETSGEDRKLGKFANMVESAHALPPEAWTVHKGSLGLMPYGGCK